MPCRIAGESCVLAASCQKTGGVPAVLQEDLLERIFSTNFQTYFGATQVCEYLGRSVDPGDASWNETTAGLNRFIL